MKPLILIVCCFSFGPIWATLALIKQNTRPLQAESNLDALDPWETLNE